MTGQADARWFRMDPAEDVPRGFLTVPAGGVFVLTGRHWELQPGDGREADRIAGLIDRDPVQVVPAESGGCRLTITNIAVARGWVVSLPDTPETVVVDALRRAGEAAREMAVQEATAAGRHPADRPVRAFVRGAAGLSAGMVVVAGLLMMLGTILPAFSSVNCNGPNCDLNSFQLGTGSSGFSPQGVVGLVLGLACVTVGVWRPRSSSRALWGWGIAAAAGVGAFALALDLVGAVHAFIPHSNQGGAPGAGVWLMLAAGILAFVASAAAFVACSALRR